MFIARQVITARSSRVTSSAIVHSRPRSGFDRDGRVRTTVTRRHTLEPRRANGRTVIPLTQQPGGIQAWKIVIPATLTEPDPKTHEGYEWLYVLSGRMRLVLGDHDLLLGPGEVAEFDTRVPHWFGSTGGQPAEVLSLFGRQGERTHVRAKSRTEPADSRE